MRYETEAASIDSVSLYLDELGQYDLLTAEQEQALAKTIEAGRDAWSELQSDQDLGQTREKELRQTFIGGLAARDVFIQANLRLVVSVAKKYVGVAPGLELLDLVQEGNIGLERAVDKFDWRRGNKFSTYATWWIKQAVHRAKDDQGRVIRLPVHMHSHMADFRRLGEAPNVNPELVLAALATETVASIDAPIGRDDTETPLVDFIADESSDEAIDNIDREQRSRFVGGLLDKAMLSDRERDVLCKYYGIGYDAPAQSVRAAAQDMDVSQTAANVAIRNAMAKLKDYIRANQIEAEF